ncbi:MAG: DUF488 family protein, partial [Planctomycetes bacterium]|nr:DUF488 family protein [Planctomycetota bacterium]
VWAANPAVVAALRRLCATLETQTVALLCSERNAVRCHRLAVARQVQQASPDVQVRHIE